MSATAEATPALKKRKFKLLNGLHTVAIGYDEKTGVPITKTFRPGEIVESTDDLAKLHNTTVSTKFQRVYTEQEEDDKAEVAAQPPKDDGLESMTIPGLRQLAEDENLDLDVDARTTKADWVAKIREARKTA